MRLPAMVLSTLLLNLFGESAPRAAERSIPYADMHRVFERLARFAGGTYVKATGRLTSSEPSIAPREIRLVIRAKSGDLPVAVAEDGTVAFPVRDDLLAENPSVVTNVPEGKLQMSFRIAVEAAPSMRFPYRLADDMRAEAKAAIARQGMLARMMMPNFEELVLEFPPGAAARATVGLASGKVELAADAEGHITVPDRRDWRRENPEIELSVLPVRMALRTAG
jgi:hypothetical protein